jgi:hypothetical protein
LRQVAACGAAFLLAVLLLPVSPGAEVVAVRYPERAARDPLVLSRLDGTRLAAGELNQSVQEGRVTTRVVFQFEDGSLHDETVVFSQEGRFQMIEDRLIQRGPAFPRGIDMTIDAASGRVTVVSTDRAGRSRRLEERLDLPPDLANGMVPTLLKNVSPEAPIRRLSLVVATPSPRLVRLALAPSPRGPAAGEGSAVVRHHVLKVEIGGLAGLLAPVFGKAPPDSHVWIRDGDPPVYVRSDQPFYAGGPLWRIDVDRAVGDRLPL